MKALIFTPVIFLLSLSISFGSTSPEILISNDFVEVLDLSNSDRFMSSTYSIENENLIFNTYEKIAVIQIYNSEDKLQFQLPVMSTKVILDKKLFDEAESKLGFMMEGSSEVHFTKVTLK